MKIHVMEVDEVALEPRFGFFEIDEKLSGKELLWQADELFIGEPNIEDYDPVRFDKVKNTSFGVVGIGTFGRGRIAIVAASYNNIDHLEDELSELIENYDYYSPYSSLLKLFYDKIV